MKPSRSQRIKPLSIQLANQIAAGEVIERPASVLKELLENSIDAESDVIEIDISQGGKGLIRIKDNGLGIRKDDLPLALSQHATSKLDSIEDLDRVSSLGFRGEALASINSVSRLSLTSKFYQSDKAWSIDTISDMDFTHDQVTILPAALSAGTLIEVRDLFYNTPARRKFLRTDKTEFRYIEDVFKRIALSHFDVAFKLTHNKKLIKKLSPVNSAQEKLLRLQKIFGENLINQLKEVNETSQNFHDLGSLKLYGWISSEFYFRSQADQQFFYVNGRYVRDKLLNHALRQAYQEILPAEQYAAYILYLNINPAAVDVNVHPTKQEVRFMQSRMVHDFIVSALGHIIQPSAIHCASIDMEQSDVGLVDSSELTQAYSYQNHSYKNKDNSILSVKDHVNDLDYLHSKNTIDIPARIQNLDKITTQYSNNLKNPTFNGQILTLAGTTLVAQEDDKLWLVDSLKTIAIINNEVLLSQLVCEQNTCEQLEQNINPLDLTILSQKLLIPENISLSQADCELLIKWQQQIKFMGVEFTLSGPQSLMLRAIPKLPFTLDIKLMVLSIVDLLINAGDNELQQVFTEQAKRVQFARKIAHKIAFSTDPLQTIDNNKQLLIMNYVSQSRYCDSFNPDIREDALKNTFRILDSNDITKIIKSR